MAPAATTGNPHESVQESITLISSFHGKIKAILVGVGIDCVRNIRVVDLIQNVFDACQPSFSLDNDEGWWIICGLEHIVRPHVGNRLLGHDLRVLSSGLQRALAPLCKKRRRSAHQNNAFAPSARPLTTNKCYPISLTPDTRTDNNFRVHLDAHTEVQFQSRSGNLQRPSDITFRECMQEVIGRDRVFHDTKVGGAFQEVLALSAGVLRANLLAIDALHGQTLLELASIRFSLGPINPFAYLVFLLRTKLDKCSMNVI